MKCRVKSIPVFDEAVLMDMDTEEDYKKLLEYNNSCAPSRAECGSILNIYNVPESIIKHCREVSRVSLEIFHSIESTGCELDEAALEAAALLHDIAKKEKKHAQAGERILKELGYNKVGSIIASHTDIEVDEKREITESEILYLADKLVTEDKVISLEERFMKSLNAYSDNPEAVEKIKIRWASAEKVVKKLEKISEKGLQYG